MRLDNNYRLKTIVRIRHKDGTVSEPFDNLSKLHPGEEDTVETGHVIISTLSRKTPILCNKWNDTVDEAIEDYRRHILGQSPAENETGVEEKGQRKPTYFEEIRQFSSEQMARFLAIIVTGGGTQKAMELAAGQANLNDGELSMAAEFYKEVIEKTDNAAITRVPDLPPDFSEGALINVFTPDGFLRAKDLNDDEYPAIETTLFDRDGKDISAAVFEYHKENHGHMIRIYTPDVIDKNPSHVIAMSELHPEKQYDWGDFETIANTQVIEDIVNRHKNNKTDTSIQILKHDLLVIEMKNKEAGKDILITVMWQNPKLRKGYPINIKMNKGQTDTLLTQNLYMKPDDDWKNLLENAMTYLEDII